MESMLDTDWITFPLVFLSLVAIALLLKRLKQAKEANRQIFQEQQKYQKQLAQTQVLEQAQRAQLQSSIEELKQTQALLHSTQDYLTSLINSMPSILVGVNQQGIITHWNANATHSTQVLPHDALGKSIADFAEYFPVSIEDIQQCISSGKAIRTKQSVTLDEVKHFQDITLYPLLANQSNLEAGAVIRVDDVSQQVQLESHLIQNRKLISLGELSINLVHELNNPLAAINQSVQVLKRQMVSPEATSVMDGRHTKLVNNIESASQRASAIVQNMLRFSRSTPYERQNCALNDLVLDTLDILDLEHQTVSVELALAEPALCINANRAEIQQALLNIIQNALHAMAEQAKPILTIRTAEFEGQALVTIQDNGKGISAQVIKRIFEPFYTTKEDGKGTGVGLSITRQIIEEQHNGDIQVASEVGIGTTFSIFLPLAELEPAIKNKVHSPQVDYA